MIECFGHCDGLLRGQRPVDGTQDDPQQEVHLAAPRPVTCPCRFRKLFMELHQGPLHVHAGVPVEDAMEGRMQACRRNVGVAGVPGHVGGAVRVRRLQYRQRRSDEAGSKV